MASTYTANLKITKPGLGDPGWSTPVNADLDLLDSQNALGNMGVSTTEVPSATLNVKVAAGTFINQSGIATAYAGAASTAMTTATTNYIYLNGSGTLTVNTTGFPSPPTLYCPLAIVVAGATTITSIADARVLYPVVGAGFLPLGGGTMTDGANVAVGTTTGTKIGTATSQKLGFFNAAPVVQPTMGAATASGSYTSAEQSMLQAVYNAVRALGLGS